MKSLSFEVPGLPESQGSARAFVVAGRARITSTNKKLGSWRRDAIVAARDARNGRPAFTGPVAVHLMFFFPRPAAHFGTGRNVGVLKASAPVNKRTQPDVDKLARAALDALTGAQVYNDDSQVVELTANKEFAGDRFIGTMVVVHELDDAREVAA